jgi:glycine/D-amino acid oxidase-like deaminating enzyme
MAISVVVVGAGAFGGWTALHLLRAGCKVTLMDAWGPGHSRASSGDESRVIRASYGPNAIYTGMVARSIPMWKENERRWGVKLFHQAGALWIAAADDSYEKASLENIRKAGMAHEVVTAAEGRKRWPQMNWDGFTWGIHEKEAGYLLARRACQAVMEGFVAENGTYVQAEARPEGEGLPAADAYVFACGPWLGRVFPSVLGKLITPTRQEMFYFGTPPGDPRFNDDRFPTWVDNSPARFYGIPGNQWRGFKLAQDVPGPVIDPSTVDRLVSPEGVALMRRYLAHRFPALQSAPLVETRVCQYEMSPDGGLIVDRHPSRNNVWLVGGGSGHGFKFSPALGEHVAQLVLGKAKQKPQFALSRFGKDAGGVGERK